MMKTNQNPHLLMHSPAPGQEGQAPLKVGQITDHEGNQYVGIDLAQVLPSILRDMIRTIIHDHSEDQLRRRFLDLADGAWGTSDPGFFTVTEEIVNAMVSKDRTLLVLDEGQADDLRDQLRDACTPMLCPSHANQQDADGEGCCDCGVLAERH